MFRVEYFVGRLENGTYANEVKSFFRLGGEERERGRGWAGAKGVYSDLDRLQLYYKRSINTQYYPAFGSAVTNCLQANQWPTKCYNFFFKKSGNILIWQLFLVIFLWQPCFDSHFNILYLIRRLNEICLVLDNDFS